MLEDKHSAFSATTGKYTKLYVYLLSAGSGDRLCHAAETRGSWSQCGRPGVILRLRGVVHSAFAVQYRNATPTLELRSPTTPTTRQAIFSSAHPLPLPSSGVLEACWTDTAPSLPRLPERRRCYRCREAPSLPCRLLAVHAGGECILEPRNLQPAYRTLPCEST